MTTVWAIISCVISLYSMSLLLCSAESQFLTCSVSCSWDNEESLCCWSLGYYVRLMHCDWLYTIMTIDRFAKTCHACSYTHTHARAHTHTHTHTHTQTHTHTPICAHTPIHMHAHTYTRAPTHTHTHTHTRMHTNPYAYTHTNKAQFHCLSI